MHCAGKVCWCTVARDVAGPATEKKTSKLRDNRRRNGEFHNIIRISGRKKKAHPNALSGIY